MSSKAPNLPLLSQVLASAQAQGIAQARLAERAGVQPETLSRAKKRDDMALGTLVRLAEVVGLRIVLEARPAAPPRHSARASTLVAALARPQFGLAWSNRHADESVLLRNALAQGRFDAIVESAAKDGLPFVAAELQRLRSSGAISPATAAKADAMLASIERGFARAGSHATA